MTPDEAAKRFKRLEEMVRRDMPQFITARVAEDAAWLVEERVTTRGINFRGGAFKPYSKKPMLTSGNTAKGKTIWSKMGGAKTRARGLEWVTIKHKGRNIHLFVLRGGYAQMRRLEGLQSEHKDFTFTRKMWEGLGVKSVSRTNNTFTVKLGGTNVDSQNKFNWNSKREGVNILAVSASEEKRLAGLVDKELQRYINKVGLS